MTRIDGAVNRMIAGGVAAALCLLGAQAQAEVSSVRFARQLGLGYLQLYVAQDLKLVEKHAKDAGLGDLTATYTPLGSPSAVNDALLSGSAEFAAAGIPPFIILWDKTRSNVDVRALGTLNSQPAYLNTNRPDVKSLADFTEKDRIAVPTVKLSYQAIILQMAAEKQFGEGQYAKLDTRTVSLSHPEATISLLSGKTEVTASFTSPPFQYQQLESDKIHRVISSYDVLGGPGSFSALWTTGRFVKDNPKTAKAVLDAMDEAGAFIKENPAKAAEIYIRLENSKLAPEFIERIITDPEIQYSTTPQNILKYTDFMARVGSIKNKPADWRELFFPDLHDRAGS
ncbi:sulfonate ABC transporter substrate-binding protein [Skermanella stibiiresistens SB22]|uniref:Sulfonate ABC transporter substrate-binding protein n=1 Tax=Skermanella stibiiresistens SB22 TaxID=1385369 RepID=W9GZE9_9PROT|nr:ABC transporter substrate-binding protein [Skermanella stibiiresistens]EWY39164.1 sulfonate ABC transporter substrate-binding protein [Skermanella stibiiresistens SB22]